MRRSYYSIVRDDSAMLLIRDIGRPGTLSITNDAKNVVKDLAEKLGNRPLYYYDSDGNLDQLLVKDGEFSGFAPGPKELK